MIQCFLFLCFFSSILNAKHTSHTQLPSDLPHLNHSNGPAESLEKKITEPSKISQILDQLNKLADELTAEKDLYNSNYAKLLDQLNSSPSPISDIQHNANDNAGRIKLSLAEIEASFELLQKQLHAISVETTLSPADQATLQQAHDLSTQISASLEAIQKLSTDRNAEIQSKILNAQAGINNQNITCDLSNRDAIIAAGHKKHEAIVAAKDNEIAKLKTQIEVLTDPDL